MDNKIPEEYMNILIDISRKYGNNRNYVLAGGGNTSWKSESVMAVKASGTELGTIGKDGFVMLDMKRLNKIRTALYSESREKREELVLADLMASRFDGENGRPSVESLLHGIIPARLVVHTHPAVVNSLTCSKNGEKKAEEIFSGRYIWVPLVDPGYVLAKTVDERLAEWTASHGGALPDYIFLANHGVFVWGDTPEEVDKKYGKLFEILENEIADTSPVETDDNEYIPDDLLKDIGRLAGENGNALFTTGEEIRGLLKTEEKYGLLMKSLTPDHIVYMGHLPLVAEYKERDVFFERIKQNYKVFYKKWGKQAKTILVPGKGFISIGTSPKASEKSRLLMLDAIRVIRMTSSFGGPEYMTDEKVRFINTWEVEKYRERQAG